MFEARDLPSISIPLNGLTWTPIGPSPIATGQAPGSPSSTGRLNGIAVDPSDPNVMYAATDTGGIWRTTDGGHTWSPRTDQTKTEFQAIAMVNRGTNDTVYAFAQDGRLFTSTDGATTFTPSSPFVFGAVVNKLTVVVVDPNDQTKDILFAAVGSVFGIPPSAFPGGVTGSGVWRSTNGGATWTNIVNPTASPFNSSPDSLSFTDIVPDPTNPNVAYAAIGNAFGDPTNGVYRTANALSANPTWTLLIGGSAFLPGVTPGNIKVAVSPVLPSEIFASVALRLDPRNGFAPLLGVFRSLDSGVNWTPMLIANPANQVNDPLNYMGITGDDNNVILVSPTSPANPLQQTIYVAGDGLANTNTVLISNDSGASWTPIGVGGDGVGTYPNIHQGVFDNMNRLVFATGGGVYRLDSVTPQVTWESLNGDVGPNGLSVVQFNGFALSPTDPNQAVGSITYDGDEAGNGGLSLHNAVLFNDTGAANNAAYGWQTVDATGFDGLVGDGQVIYNPFSPNTVYRVTRGGAGQPLFIRRSDDGGQTWTGVTSGFQANPFDPGLYVVPLAIDPSQPNRLFSGFNAVQATDTNGDAWRTAIQVSTTGATVAVPDLPTTIVDRDHGGPIGLTAIGVGRESGATLPGFFTGINGVTLFVGTTDDSTRDAMGVPQNQAAGTGPQLYVNLIPTNSLPWPPPMTTWGNRSWANITPPGITGTVDQVLLDPTNNSTLYVFTSSGQVFRGTNFTFGFTIVPTNVIAGVASVNWTDLTGNLPSGVIPSIRPQELALDPRIVTQANDDILYAGTARGVWKLTNPGANFGTGNPPVWQEVGLDPNTGARTLPAVPISAISLNTSTGILGAATYGRGVYEIQIRGVIGGSVFEDTNGNGVRDANEPGSAGNTVRLIDLDTNAEIATTVTDATGHYQFNSLRNGNYRVTVSGPGGLFQTTAQPPDFTGFTEQSTALNVNFGFFRAGSITGTKVEDFNANGIADPGETPLPGFTIYIDRNGNGVPDPGEPSAVTDANGRYTFDATNVVNGPGMPNGIGPDVIFGDPNNPFSGPYVIREVQQTGFQATLPVAGGSRNISITSGQALTAGADFGNIRIASIAGLKFNDLNGNGVKDPSDPGIGGFTMQLLDATSGNVLRTVVSAPDGSFIFRSLVPGTYRVTEQVPAGWAQTTPNPATITVTATSQVTGLTFGNFKNVTLGGLKFNDVNGNGSHDANEPGVRGFVIDLINFATGQIVKQSTTDAGGFFSFTNVGPLPGGGAYAIREEQQPGWTQTTVDPQAFAPTSGNDVTAFQFGNFKRFAVTGIAYIDSNGNGVRDGAERGAPGFIIQLRNSANAVVFQTTSAFDGSYSIPSVGPGNFVLIEVPRNGFTLTQGAAGYPFNGVSGGDRPSLDFGNFRRSTIVTALDQQGPPTVTVRDAATGQVLNSFNAYAPNFFGGVRVAVGYVNADTVPDIITAPGPGGGPHIRVFDGATGNVIREFMAYDPGFAGGVYVAAGDVNGDGVDDIITGPGAGGGPNIRVFDGRTGVMLMNFLAYSPAFTGGVQVAAGDVNGDGRADIIVGAGPGGGPHVEAFSGANGALLTSFFAYDAGFRGGVFVAAGDVNGDGRADIITGPGLGGGPHVEVFDALSRALISSFLAFPTPTGGQIGPWQSGARVASFDVNLDGTADIIVSPGRGQGPLVRILDGTSLALINQFNATDPTFLGGIFVAGR